MNPLFSQINTLCCTLCLIVAAVTCPANANTEVDLLKQTARGFSAIAKDATPAVVAIEIRGQEPDRSDDDEDPLNFFRDDFFNRFFGIPQERKRPQKAPKRSPHSKQQVPLGRGSGFFVSPEGHIMTNSHVVKEADTIVVILNDGKELNAELIGLDSGTDIAILKVAVDTPAYLKFGDADTLDVGEWVVAIGNPLGLQASVTVGVVSAKGRNNLQITDFDDFIQTDAAINPGNSGGPLLNLDGEVVGMNTAIATKSGGYMGIGFAIPSNMAKHVMEQIIKTGGVTRGFLGIAPQELDKELASSFKLDKTEGILVAHVEKDSPGERAGLKEGDIILSINEIPMKSVGMLRKTIALMDPNTDVKLVIWRNGETLTIVVTLGTNPQHPSKEVARLFDQLGFDVIDLSPDLVEELGLSGEKGVIVKQIAPRSAAAMAGLRPGSLIKAVNRKEVSSVAEFMEALKIAQQEKRLLLLVKQGPMTRFISLRLE